MDTCDADTACPANTSCSGCKNVLSTGGACDDGDSCTTDDVCDAKGVCKGTQKPVTSGGDVTVAAGSPNPPPRDVHPPTSVTLNDDFSGSDFDPRLWQNYAGPQPAATFTGSALVIGEGDVNVEAGPSASDSFTGPFSIELQFKPHDLPTDVNAPWTLALIPFGQETGWTARLD